MHKTKIISGFLIFELIYTLINILPELLVTFDPSQLIYYARLFFILALLLSAIGIYFQKKWAVISLWIYILHPLLIGYSLYVGFGGYYYIVVINTAIVTYLSVTWNLFSKKGNV
ncbi:MAG: hypothetical protein WC659_00130 [Patescibacteria group bacterium]